MRSGLAGIVDYGMAMSARDGEIVTGDRCVVRAHPGGVILAVIDGLGHGGDAAAAADIAAQVVQTHPGLDIVDIVNACHARLRSSRGVVMTLVSITPGARILTAVGVGNVQGMIVRRNDSADRPARDFILLRGGVVGHLLPPLRPSVMQVTPGDLFVLATDGVSIEFMTEARFAQPPEGIAERILGRHAVHTDDALVLVARYIGD
ncbi:MAG TPA: SpoIIE family protein phosphatase [Spirochaetia bacterium]|nr:SpoIIE family protein phosphatase [Spirochaetia bacterium]